MSSDFFDKQSSYSKRALFIYALLFFVSFSPSVFAKPTVIADFHSYIAAIQNSSGQAPFEPRISLGERSASPTRFLIFQNSSRTVTLIVDTKQNLFFGALGQEGFFLNPLEGRKKMAMRVLGQALGPQYLEILGDKLIFTGLVTIHDENGSTTIPAFELDRELNVNSMDIQTFRRFKFIGTDPRLQEFVRDFERENRFALIGECGNAFL